MNHKCDTVRFCFSIFPPLPPSPPRLLISSTKYIWRNGGAAECIYAAYFGIKVAPTWNNRLRVKKPQENRKVSPPRKNCSLPLKRTLITNIPRPTCEYFSREGGTDESVCLVEVEVREEAEKRFSSDDRLQNRAASQARAQFP